MSVPREYVDPLFGVLVVVEHLAGVPVVDHLVVIPLHKLRHVGIEVPVVGIGEVIGVLSAILVKGLRDSAFRLGYLVAPDPSVGQGQGLGNWDIRVHRVATVDEEVGISLGHGAEDRHSADVGIDAEPLPRHVAGPDQSDVAGRRRRGSEDAGGRLAERPVRVERHPVVHLRIRG